MTRALAVSIACVFIIGWAAYGIARIAHSPEVNRLVVVVMVASMISGGFAAIAGAKSARRRWRP